MWKCMRESFLRTLPCNMRGIHIGFTSPAAHISLLTYTYIYMSGMLRTMLFVECIHPFACTEVRLRYREKGIYIRSPREIRKMRIAVLCSARERYRWNLSYGHRARYTLARINPAIHAMRAPMLPGFWYGYRSATKPRAIPREETFRITREKRPSMTIWNTGRAI